MITGLPLQVLYGVRDSLFANGSIGRIATTLAGVLIGGAFLYGASTFSATKDVTEDRLVSHLEYTQLDDAESLDEIENINKGIGWNNYSLCIRSRYIIAKEFENIIVFDFAKCFDNVVGYVIVRDEGESAYLAFLAVNVALEKSGLGSAILSYTINKVRQVGREKLEFICSSSVLGFYEKFAKEEKIDFHYKRYCEAFSTPLSCTYNLSKSGSISP